MSEGVSEGVSGEFPAQREAEQSRIAFSGRHATKGIRVSVIEAAELGQA